LCKPWNDLPTFRSSCGNLTDTIGHDRYQLNTGIDVAGSVENVVLRQLSSTNFPISSVSGGVAYDAFPRLATALNPLPSPSDGRIASGRSEMTATDVDVLNQPEPNHFMSPSHTVVGGHGRYLALAPAKIQADAKTMTDVISKASDVYEFRDEDDSEVTTTRIDFRRGKPSMTVKDTMGSLPTGHGHVYFCNDSQPPSVCGLNQKCRSVSAVDAGIMLAPQNVATIFDMDSKSIHPISLPVKQEPPDSVPLYRMNNTLLHAAQSTSCGPIQNQLQHGKHSLSSNNDQTYKRVRLDDSTGSAYVGFGDVGTSYHFPPNIQNLISQVRKMNECDKGISTFDSGPEKSFPLQPRSTITDSQPLSFGSARFPDHLTPAYTTIKLVDASARSHIMNASCSEVVKHDREPLNSLPTGQFPFSAQSVGNSYLSLLRGSAPVANSNVYSVGAVKPVMSTDQSVYPVYASSECYRYSVFRQPNSMSASQQLGSDGKDRIKYENDTKWWQLANPCHTNAVQSICRQPNVSRSVLLEGSKKCNVGTENLQHSESPYVLDLSSDNNSQISSPSSLHISHHHGFYPDFPPAAVASRFSDIKVRQMINDTSSPYLLYSKYSHDRHHLQHCHNKQQQHVAPSVKQEELEEKKVMTTDEEKLLYRIKCNEIEQPPQCQCRGLLLSLSLFSSDFLACSCYINIIVILSNVYAEQLETY